MDWLRGLIRPIAQLVKAEIMNELEAKFTELETTIADEKAQVLTKVNGLEDMIAELQNKVAGGIDTNEVINRINQAIADVRGIVADGVEPTAEAESEDAPTPDAVAEVPPPQTEEEFEAQEDSEEETEEE